MHSQAELDGVSKSTSTLKALAQAEPDSAEKLDKELGAAVRCGLTDVRKVRPHRILFGFTLTSICGVYLPEQPCHAPAMHGCLTARVHHHLQPAASLLIGGACQESSPGSCAGEPGECAGGRPHWRGAAVPALRVRP